MIVGGYSLHLYCDNPKCSSGKYASQQAFGEFDEHNEREARKAARKRGWAFKKTDDGEKCYCKECSK